MVQRRARSLSLLCLLGLACDEPTSSPATTPAPAPASAEDRDREHATSPTHEAGDAGEAVEPSEPAEPAPPVGGPSCDQRELSTKGGELKHLCVDYSEHRGASEPRCFEGVELGEGPCPREGVVASCTLEATGVVLNYYAGVDVEAARGDCEAARGDYSAGSTGSTGAGER